MDPLAFYDHGCEPSLGGSGIHGFLRRRVRNLLLPMFLRLVKILGSVCHRLEMAEAGAEDLNNRLDDLRRRQEELADKLQATLAFGWDYVAMARRLAILEDQVETLLIASENVKASVEPTPFSKAG